MKARIFYQNGETLDRKLVSQIIIDTGGFSVVISPELDSEGREDGNGIEIQTKAGQQLIVKPLSEERIYIRGD